MISKKSSKSFNFLDLDVRLNTKKIQQIKKDEKQKNILSIYQKKLPNLQLMNECDQAIKSYKDHYNINRRFSLFFECKKEKSQQNQRKIQRCKEVSKLPSLTSSRFQSLSNPFQIDTKRSLSLFEAQKVMKPIKSNQYLSQKGIVLLPEKSESTVFDKSKDQSVKKNQSIKDLNLKLTSYRNMSQKNLKNETDEKINEKVTQLNNQNNEKNKIKIETKRKRKLKILFRHNIELIISKMKIMKLSFSQLLENKVFDKSIPYKFGQQIFYAIKDGNEPKVFRIMMQNRLSIFSFDPTEKTTLIWACIRGYDNIAQLLLSNGVQPHAQDMNGKTSLYYAIKYNHLKCAKILFIYSYHLQENLQKQNMTVQMRKMLRIGISSHKFLKTFNSINKKKEHFERQYKYYFKE